LISRLSAKKLSLLFILQFKANYALKSVIKNYKSVRNVPKSDTYYVFEKAPYLIKNESNDGQKKERPKNDALHDGPVE
jgi:hypothetical protein